MPLGPRLSLLALALVSLVSTSGCLAASPDADGRIASLQMEPALQDPSEARSSAASDPARVQNRPQSSEYAAPDDVSFSTANVISEGVRLTSQWFVAKADASKSLPTVIMAHGWGGTAAGFREDAVDLARAGYRVMLFDYRGWGESDGRVVLTKAIPKGASGETFNAEVKELRGYVDPYEQTEDWFNAISFAVAQPGVDPDRIGVRGSSFSGGYVVYVAANDARVKAVVSQVGSYDSRPEARGVPNPAKDLADADLNASQLATGQIGYPPDRLRVGAQTGASPGNKRMRWMPMEHLHRVTQPTLFVMAEGEELFPNATQGLIACERVKGSRKAIMVPGILHYGIYSAERELAIKVAIDWFDEYLKPTGANTRISVDRTDAERGDCNAPFVRPEGVGLPRLTN